MTERPALERLADRLRAEGGLLAEATTATGRDAPHVAGLGPGRALAVAAIREGHELHGGSGRVVDTDDPDLALLAGDRLYALGLAELAEAGDLAAVRIMAGVIGASSAARGARDDAGAEAAWEQGVRALGGSQEPPPSADR